MAEDAIRASEARLRETQRIAGLGSWDLDLTSGRLSWAGQVADIFGVNAADCPQTVDALLAWVHPGDRPAFRIALERAVGGKAGLDIEHRLVRPDGGTRFLRERGEVVADEEGRPFLLTGTVLDLTALRLSQQRGATASAFFLEAERIAQLGSWDLDVANGRLTWSDEACRLFGTTVADFPGTYESFVAFVLPEDRPAPARAHARASRDTPQLEAEYRIRRPDDQVRWLYERGVALFDDSGEMIRRLGVVMDVTERRQAEARLAESETRYRRLFEHMAAGSVLFGVLVDDHERPVDLTLLDANAQFERVTGVPRDQAIGRRITEIVLGIEHDDTDWIGIFGNVALTGEALQLEEPSQLLGRYLLASAYAPLERQCAVTFVDVTERRLAERALRESEARFRAIFSAAATGMALAGIDGRVLDCNDAFCRLVGRSRDEITQMDFPSLIHPDDRATHVALLSDLVAGRRASYVAEIENLSDAFFTLDREWTFSYVNAQAEVLLARPRHELVGRNVWTLFPHAIGSRFQREYERALRDKASVAFEEFYAPLDKWFEVRAYPSDDGLVVYFRDVTERRQQREALLASEERFRLLSRATNDAIWDWDFVTDALWWNDGFETLFQFSREEVEPTIESWTRRIHPDDAPRIVRDVHEAIDGGATSWSGEYRFRRKDGSYAFVLDRGHVIRDEAGRAVRMVGGMTDLTARKEAEERLREQAALLDRAQDAILVRDIEDRVTYWNKSAERLYGWTAEEVLGRPVTDLLYADISAFQQATRHVHEREEWVGEIQQCAKNGQALTVEARWSLVRSDAGEPRSILAINTDLTERKLLEQQFLRAQRLESIGTLAGGIAHDLNNVLAPIMMATDLLRLSYSTGRAAEILDTLETSARRGAEMVSQVLSFARGMEGQRVAVQVSYLVADLVKIVKDTFPKNIAVDVQLVNDLWVLEADPTQLHQVLLNLCVNARDAIPDRRHDHDSRREHGRRRSLRGHEHRGAGRPARAAPGGGHGYRHPGRHRRAHLRSLLHHEGHRQGDRPRPVDDAGHREEPRWLHSRRQRSRPGCEVLRVPARGLNARAHPDCRRPAPAAWRRTDDPRRGRRGVDSADHPADARDVRISGADGGQRRRGHRPVRAGALRHRRRPHRHDDADHGRPVHHSGPPADSAVGAHHRRQRHHGQRQGDPGLGCRCSRVLPKPYTAEILLKAVARVLREP